MKGRRSLQKLVEEAGIVPVSVRQPCLPAPSQPAIIASEEDHALARSLLVNQRRNDPAHRDPSKQLKNVFRSSKEKEKLRDINQWVFSQEEVDQALSAVIDKPTTSPGLIQAFLSLGAKVNYIQTPEEKKNKGTKKVTAAARRSTVLQRAATLRRADSVSLLASSGADQTTLDEGLKAALSGNDNSCIQELLRHGADINKFPNSLADAVRSSDQNLVRLLLRAPKALRPEIISSCLPAAVQQKSESIISLLVGYGADPNFNEASALKMAISAHEYRLAVALVAGPIPLTTLSLQRALEHVMQMPTAHEVHQFLQLLLSCGLPANSGKLPGLLVAASKRNDTRLAHLLIDYGVSTGLNEAECLRHAIAHSNWALTDAILATPISPRHASVALTFLPSDAPRPERLHVIDALVQRGANGSPLGRWLLRAVEESDSSLIDLLVNVGAPLVTGKHTPIHAAIVRRDLRSLQKLLKGRLPPQALADAFPLLRHGYSQGERLDIVRLLLQHGARGAQVNQALIDAVADTSVSRDKLLIEELIQHGAIVDFDNGKALHLATMQADLPIVQVLSRGKPSRNTTSTALPLAFSPNGSRHSTTLQICDLLLANGVERQPALQTLQIAMNDGKRNLDIISRFISVDAGLIGPAFQLAISFSNKQMKAPIITYLLEMGIQQPVLDDALVTETRNALKENDTTMIEVLLDHGASVNHSDGECLSLAVASGHCALTRLLLSGKDTPAKSTVTKAFRALFHDSNMKFANQFDIAKLLLPRSVDQSAIDLALRTVLDVSYDENSEDFINFLLQHHASVNTADGACFVLAARRPDFKIFDKLLMHGPDFSSVVPLLLRAKLEESILIKALKECFDHGCKPDCLESDRPLEPPALILALQEYPRSEALVKIFLNNGCNPNITVSDVLDSRVGEEIMPSLVYALAQPQKTISTAVIIALLDAGASPTRTASQSELSPVAIAARESRPDIIQELLIRGADPSVRDKWNRSALYFASSTSITSIAETLAPYALKDDGSLHEAARCLQLDIARILVKYGHHPNFPSRLHDGRTALSELCLNAEALNSPQRTKLRQLIRLFLDNGANPKFKVRNERSAVVLALDNPYDALEVTEALLETEIWEDINDEKHMFRDDAGLWYSPIKYVELVPNHSRTQHRQALVELLQDKGCEPKFYSEYAQQPPGAIGMPESIARLFDRQREHQLTLKLAEEANEHARMLEESTHRDLLRRKKERSDADMAAAATAQAQYHQLSQQKHDQEMSLIRSAERVKRSEKEAWHSLQMFQEADAAASRARIEEQKASAAYSHEQKMAGARMKELEHRAGVERKALKEKEDMFKRNVDRQKMLTDRLDESAQLHARLRQERPAIEGPSQWGSVD
ncbi:hypothetical protein CC78DRAFT_581771 [Lojkania enalia]|uniref:Ankyrin repeat containing protein n=1 Tax=Lojkania enalia TaxID=147567 RepID=A0A9P4K6X7_9PLEO|nr:hypothetical protein CC78DRAFT_581771 [Didymosphaeria enalia]